MSTRFSTQNLFFLANCLPDDYLVGSPKLQVVVGFPGTGPGRGVCPSRRSYLRCQVFSQKTAGRVSSWSWDPHLSVLVKILRSVSKQNCSLQPGYGWDRWICTMKSLRLRVRCVFWGWNVVLVQHHSMISQRFAEGPATPQFCFANHCIFTALFRTNC